MISLVVLLSLCGDGNARWGDFKSKPDQDCTNCIVIDTADVQMIDNCMSKLKYRNRGNYYSLDSARVSWDDMLKMDNAFDANNEMICIETIRCFLNEAERDAADWYRRSGYDPKNMSRKKCAEPLKYP